MISIIPAGAAEERHPVVQQDLPVTATDLITKQANNSPMLAVDPTNPDFVVIANRVDSPDFSCALQISGDGGRGWTTVRPVAKLPKGADKCYAPEVAFDGHGTLYYLFIGLRGRGNGPAGAFLTSTTNRGRTFTAPRRVLGPERFMVRMAIDPTIGMRGRIHLVWLEAVAGAPSGGFPPQANPIMAVHSDDGGVTFSTPVQVSDVERERVVAPALVVGPNHAVHVMYYDLEDDVRDYQGLEGPPWDGKWSLVAATSTNGGVRFGRGVVVDADLLPPERVMLIYTMPPPALAADDTGRLYAAWYDGRNGDWDVFLKSSSDGGRTWNQAKRLNDDRLHNKRHQYLPRLSAAPGGRLDAIFYDRRGNIENRGNDVYYTFSTNGGRTFSPNVKLTSFDSDSRIGPRYLVPSARGLVEFGSRLALASERSKVLAAWTDTRNDGRFFKAQEIFATELDLVSDGDANDRTATTGLVLGVGTVLLVVAMIGRRRRRSHSKVA